uniref:RNA-dependent RNA polymerase n=1 Tax=Opuntia streptacantha TaxID=393608 RepID=A0A7C9EMP1_OPUST
MDRLLILGRQCVEERNLLQEKILRLVDIYYDALDAPKKGLKVEVPSELIPKKFPHYMGRGEMFSYRSTSVLGEIFDKADELKLEGLSIQGEIWFFSCDS